MFHKSIKNGDILDIESRLHDNEEILHKKDRFGRCSLHIAAQRKNMEVARLLLSRGADINAADNAGYPPFFYFPGLHRESTDALLSKQVERKTASSSNEEDEWRNYRFTEKKEWAVVARTLPGWINYFAEAAAWWRDDSIMDLEIHALKGNMLHAIARSSHRSVQCDKLVDYLMRNVQGLCINDRDSEGYTPLLRAYHDPETIRVLLDKGADVYAENPDKYDVRLLAMRYLPREQENKVIEVVNKARADMNGK